MEIKQAKVETTYRHKKTGETFKERKDWENNGFKDEDMAQDVKVIMPDLDLFSKCIVEIMLPKSCKIRLKLFSRKI